ncbi:MAG TPA: DUF2459 domain-containing protein [Victivallales bacterium]|nr:DUF2459 domain-containing protein [Victivallales bacterium]
MKVILILCLIFILDNAVAKKITIFVVSHRHHSGIVIPGNYVKLNYLKNSKSFLHAKYIEFGYGDRNYYMSTNPGLSQGITALFWPTESVIHVVIINKSLEKIFPSSKIYKIRITEEKLRLLNKYIFDSFKYQNKNNPPIAKGRYLNSYFYAGSRNFYIFNTCNTWVAKALKYSGYNINPYFIASQSSLENSLKRISDSKVEE